jgi:hypothetical protein
MVVERAVIPNRLLFKRVSMILPPLNKRIDPPLKHEKKFWERGEMMGRDVSWVLAQKS